MNIRRMKRSATFLVTVTLLGAVVLGGCSSGSDNAADTTSTTGRTSTTAGGADTTATTGATDTTAAAGTPEVTPEMTDLAAQINDADLGCDAVDAPRVADGADNAAQCELPDAPAYLYTFTDDDQRDTFIDGGGVIDCTFIFGAGISFDYVVADGVIVRPDSNDDAQALADALGGEVRTITCETPDTAG